MSALSNALRAAANLLDAGPQGVSLPSVAVECDNTVALQFDPGDVAAVEAWGAMLQDALPGTLDGAGYRQIEGVWQDVKFDAWAPLS